MSRICSQCEYRVDVQRGEGIYPECSNTKRKNNGISLRIVTSPSWCAFKRKARRKRKTSPRALLVRELDKLWRIAVVLQAGSQCEMTGKFGSEGRGHALNAHHVIGRSNFRVRWALFNGACLTAGAHTLAPNSAHKNPIYFLEEMIQRRGRAWYDKLQTEAYACGGGIKHTMQDLQAIKAHLKEVIEKYDK